MPQRQNIHAFSRLVNNPLLFKWHIEQLPNMEDQKMHFHAPRIIAEWKLHHADSLQQLESWLEPTEVMALLNQPDCLEQLKRIGKQCL
jgi:membrane glycosyltransferase